MNKKENEKWNKNMDQNAHTQMYHNFLIFAKWLLILGIFILMILFFFVYE